ncbi:MAG: recombinase family protein [Lachnospiraceae bacterium]|nr:recombinase family protein [Lachnospiraceae bacterium]
MGKSYSYVRVSTQHQNEDRQLLAMLEIGIVEKNIYIDKQSGKDFNRPMYKKLLKNLKEGDILYVKSIDRLGRNYEEILEQWRILTKEKKVDIVILDMPLLDTRKGKDLLGTLIADLVLALLSYVSENERKTLKERQMEGIEAARRRGVKFGRPEKTAPDFNNIYKKWLSKEITANEAARLCGLKTGAFYYRARKRKASILNNG